MVRSRRGLTLLEVLVAVTVFAIVSVAVFGVFRSGVRAYRSSTVELGVIERARFALDSLESDLANLYYLDEDTYNRVARERLEEYQREYYQAQEREDFTDFDRKYGPRDGKDVDPNDPSYIGDPYERFRMIDLQLAGEDGGDLDTLAFAIHRRLATGSPGHFWGLSRVRYTVSNGVLVRTTEDVGVTPLSPDGTEREKETGATHTIIAEGVKAFDLSYCFWVDHQWYEVDSWLSANRIMRNGEYFVAEHDLEEQTQGINTAGLQVDPNATRADLLNESNSQPTDGVPAYLRLRLAIADPDSPSRTIDVTRIIRLPASVERWQPSAVLDEDQQEDERIVRDQEYRMVFPGTLRKDAP